MFESKFDLEKEKIQHQSLAIISFFFFFFTSAVEMMNKINAFTFEPNPQIKEPERQKHRIIITIKKKMNQSLKKVMNGNRAL